MFGCRRHRVVASGGKFSAALGVNAASNQLGNGRPRHESFGASFVLHAAQMPGGLSLVAWAWGRHESARFSLFAHGTAIPTTSGEGFIATTDLTI